MKRLIAGFMALALLFGLLGCKAAEDDGLSGVTAGQSGNLQKPENNFGDFMEQQDKPEEQQPQEEQPQEEQPQGEQKPPNTPAPNPNEPQQDLSDAVVEEEEIDYTGEDWITVCSYNIKALYHTNTSKTDVVDVLRKIDADIVGMQEVDHRLSFTGQVEYLARELGYPYYKFAMCEEADSEGHGIMSRYMIKEYKEVSYQFQQGEPRKYTRAVLVIDGKDVAFYNTHLTTGDWHETGYQFEELIKAIYKEKLPVILTGDFNLKMVEQQKRIDTDKLLPLNGLHDMTVSHPFVKWDNIYITEKDFEYFVDIENLVGIQSMDTNASDHKPIWTYIKFK